MRRIRNRLTYANVMSTLAVVLALGGGAAYAANTVSSSDIVNDQVYSADVRNDTLSSGGLAAADLRAGAVGTSEVLNDTATGGGLAAADLRSDSVGTAEIANGGVRSAEVQNESLTGADIAESTLQNVNAGTVGGLQVRKINFQVPPGTGPTTVLDLAGLQITAECQNFGDGLDVKAFTSKNGASAFYFAGGTPGADDTNSVRDISSVRVANRLFDIGDQLQIDNASPWGGDETIGTLNYSAPDGSVVVAHLVLDEARTASALVGCDLTGTAIGG